MFYESYFMYSKNLPVEVVKQNQIITFYFNKKK